MSRRSSVLALVAILPVIGCGAFSPPLDTVDSVDLTQYAGLWYEVASYPAPFQAGCTGTTAEYTLLDDGRVGVVNTCNKGSLDGPVDRIEGTARVPDPAESAKLKVRFFPLFEADYWVIDLGPNYEYAVVGEPSRRFLWILSRTPTLDEATYQDILSRLPDLNYDPDRLVRTVQPSE